MQDWHQTLNIQGVKSLSIIPDTDYSSSNGGILELVPNALVQELLFSHRSCALQVESADTPAGKLYTASVTANIPKMSVAVHDFLDIYQETRWVLVLEDFNGYTHVIGNANSGAALSFSQKTGGERNETLLAFTKTHNRLFKISTDKIDDMWFTSKVAWQSIYIDGNKDGDAIGHLLNGKVYIDAYINENGDVNKQHGFKADYANDGEFTFNTGMIDEFINTPFTGYLICGKYA